MTPSKSQLRARDVMVADPVCVEPSTTLRQLARILSDNEISGAPVVNHEGRIVGVVSKTDINQRCAEGVVAVPPDFFHMLGGAAVGDDDDVMIPETLLCVQDFMNMNPVTVTPETSVLSIAKLMYEKRMHRVIVVNNDRFPVGIITSLDLIGTWGRS